MTNRFASLAPLPARLLLGAVALLVALGVAVTWAPAPGPKLATADRSDSALYRAIAARSDTPSDYVAAATAEQRARGYPLRPFVTVREPALALITYRLGLPGAALLYRLLALATFAALVWRLRGVAGRGERIGATLLAALSVLLVAQPVLALWHEAWAGLLIALALAVRAERRWAAACGIALAAVLVRELAAPMLLAMAFAAPRRAERIGWIAALGLFAAMMTWQAQTVHAHLLPGDPASPGWTMLGGWRFILSIAHGTSLLLLLPMPLVALAVPLALCGWASRGDGFGDRVTLALMAAIVPFMVVGRPDNFYWGLMIAPLLPIGLAFAPGAMRALARQARPHSPCRPPCRANASS